MFDCLLNSQISSLTKESIDRLQNETKKIEADHLSLLSTDPLLVWLSDLLSLHDKFSTELNKTPSPLKNNSNSHPSSFKKKKRKKEGWVVFACKDQWWSFLLVVFVVFVCTSWCLGS